MATTVISAITQSDDGRDILVTGTVGGTAHLYRRDNRPFLPNQSMVTEPGSLNAQAFAQEYAADFANLTAAIALLASVTYAYLPCPGQPTVAIVYGGTPVVEVGFDQLEITATVGGTSTIVIVSEKHLLEWVNQWNFLDYLAAKFYAQAALDVKSNAAANAYIASFTTT